LIMKLLEPYKLGPFTLRNRVVMAPMTRNRVTATGLVGEMTATYYSQRASMGLLVSEAISISEQAIGFPLIPGIYNSAQVQAWRHVNDKVHEAGGLIFAQLWHAGRAGHSSARGGVLPVAPSALPVEGQQAFTFEGPKNYEVPYVLTTEEVRAVINDYRIAAENAKAAGFDGVEFHAAFGYLPNQFLVDGVNDRVDEYGGSIENRCRFVLEAMQVLVSVWGPGRVGIKLSPSGTFHGIRDSNPRALYGYLTGALNTLPLAYLHFMQPLTAIELPPHWPNDVLKAFAGLSNHTIIANGGYNQQGAEREIETGRAALVSFGALALANPDLPERFAKRTAVNAPDAATFYGGDDRGYIDYPVMQQRADFSIRLD
jgi:N-ethylmaleimide reductase